MRLECVHPHECVCLCAISSHSLVEMNRNEWLGHDIIEQSAGTNQLLLHQCVCVCVCSRNLADSWWWIGQQVGTQEERKCQLLCVSIIYCSVKCSGKQQGDVIRQAPGRHANSETMFKNLSFLPDRMSPGIMGSRKCRCVEWTVRVFILNSKRSTEHPESSSSRTLSVRIIQSEGSRTILEHQTGLYTIQLIKSRTCLTCISCSRCD